MLNPLIQKLQHGAELTDEDRQILEKVISEPRIVDPRHDIIQEGDQPENVHLILEGFACRYKLLRGGERQIMAYLVPGDLCDLHVSILGEMDHSLSTLSRCKIVLIPRRAIEDMTENHGRINRALWWATLVDEATLREWLVNMGRRPADKQLAHLLVELLVRLQAVGLATENSYEFPVTQAELADTLGISTVHVNRVLQQLRKDGLLTLRGNRLTIIDVDASKEFAEFNPNYLHFTRRRDGGTAGGDKSQRERGNGDDRDAPH
jgi:CRP-like cAMP-binding protein